MLGCSNDSTVIEDGSSKPVCYDLGVLSATGVFSWSYPVSFMHALMHCEPWFHSIQEFVKGCGSVTKRLVDGLLDKMTAGDHTKAVHQIRQVP